MMVDMGEGMGIGGWEFWKCLEELGGGWAEAVGRSWGVVGIFGNVREDRGGGWPGAVGRLLTPPLDYYDA